jgi:hypothetical protein
MIQVGLKSTIALYYQTIDTKTALENCEYKTITVCKGSCYVTRQIKIVSSSTNKESQQSPQIDLNIIKDVITEENSNSPCCSASLEKTEVSADHVDHYSFNHISLLIKPPIA